jgi:nicotinate-nucleotide adenylyltransferase
MGMQEPGRKSSRVGVLGGTFDPIHTGHLIAASEALHELRLDLVMFVPTGQPWQKESFSNPEDRYQMTIIGTAPNRRFAASRMEIDRIGPTFTIDTMQALRDFHGEGTELFFIIGADAVLKLDTWHRFEGLEKLAEIIAVTRPGFDLAGLRPRPGWPRIHVLEMPLIDISSTDIRERAGAGRPIEYLVPPGVARYIVENGLYVSDGGRRGEDV